MTTVARGVGWGRGIAILNFGLALSVASWASEPSGSQPPPPADANPAILSESNPALPDTPSLGDDDAPAPAGPSRNLAVAVSPVTGAAPLRVTFDFSGSTQSLSDIARSAVDMTGDGVFDVEGAGAGRIAVTYREAGSFRAKARVMDWAGAIASTNVTITVTGNPSTNNPRPAQAAPPLKSR